MPSWLSLSVPWWELVIRSVIIYVVFFIGLRAFGKREVGQFTVFDFVLILLVANALQPAITGPDNSVTGGVIIIITLLLINRGLAFVRRRFPAIDDVISPKPTVIARDGKWIKENFDREDLSLEDAEMALREHGVEKVEDVSLAELEEDGSISVVPKDQTGLQPRRRRVVRFKHT
ncbi:MAG TPA: YetF domain-containing protein [Candidatus Limnocylindrales bacterium]|nr:YetF domain-containing protein [Candidatus Limnocylindrales bacterium]